MTATEATTRMQNGRFAPGQSGNPAGRPKGSLNRATILKRALYEGEDERMARLVIEEALGGDQVALRFLLARLLPKQRATPIALDLAEGDEHHVATVHAAAIRALADGEITPEEGAQIAKLLAAKQPVMAADQDERNAAEIAALRAAHEAAASARKAPPAPRNPTPSPLAGPSTRAQEGRGGGCGPARTDRQPSPQPPTSPSPARGEGVDLVPPAAPEIPPAPAPETPAPPAFHLYSEAPADLPPPAPAPAAPPPAAPRRNGTLRGFIAARMAPAR